MKPFIYNKKRISILAIGLIFFLPKTQGQNLNTIQQLYAQRELQAAQQQVAGYVQKNPNDVQGWILKARIYNAIGNDAGLKYVVADSRMDACQALQKAVKLDPSLTKNTLAAELFALPIQIYNGYEEDGIAAYNTAVETKDAATAAAALSIFKKAAIVSSFIYSSGWCMQAIDSNNIFYSARSAIMAGKTDDAAMYCKKIADAKITKTQANSQFEILYQWLVFYYRKQNKEAALHTYMDIATALYPHSGYYYLNEIDWLREQKRYDQLYPKYQQLFALGFDKAEYRFASLQDLFAYIYTDQGSVVPNETQRTQLQKGLEDYIGQNPAAVNGKLLMAKYYTNLSVALHKETMLISTLNPAVFKDYDMRIKKALVSSNKYLREIVFDFPNTDRVMYNEAIDLLVNNLNSLGQFKAANIYSGKRK